MFVDDRSLALKYNYKSSHGIYKYLKDVLIDLTRYMGHVSQFCFHPSLEVKNNVTTVEKKIERKKFLNYDFDCSTLTPFQKYAFSLSWKLYRSIRVFTAALMCLE